MWLPRRRPPAAALNLLRALDSFAVILNTKLTVVYANAAAREDPRITGEQLRDPGFQQRARRVLATGITDTRTPTTQDPADSVQTRIVQITPHFLAVLAFDLGEEQRLTAMRRDFIANVSHELKTPIAAIGLLSEAVLEGAEDPEVVRTFATTLKKEARRLGDLSRDIIHLSEAQSQQPLEIADPVPLLQILAEEVAAHHEYATGRHVLINYPHDPHDALVRGQRSTIAAVFANVLSNAIRYSHPGDTVTVTVEHSKRECTVRITDQGAGIAPEHLSRIFERFYRADAARSRAEGGTGLGLSIARHTMRSLGGDIDVWSQLGEGSSFILSFPTVAVKSGSNSRKTNAQTAAIPLHAEERPA